jgi:hypothetical protein
MRPIVLVLTLLAIPSGCSQRAGGIGIGVGLGIAVGGGVLASNPSGDARTDQGSGMVGGGIAAIGAIVVLGSLIGMTVGPPAPEKQPVAGPPRDLKAEQEQSRRRQVAVDLTSTASAAAQADDCATVEKIGAKVLAVDRAIHKNVFSVDVAIKRCLDGATAPDAPPPQITPVAEPAPRSLPPREL